MFDTDALWDEVYNMDGLVMLYYLNQFFPPKKPFKWGTTSYGEEVYLIDPYYPSADYIFGRWDLWRQEVSYYFDSLMEWRGRLHYETVKDILVYKIARILIADEPSKRGLLSKRSRPPKHEERFLF